MKSMIFIMTLFSISWQTLAQVDIDLNTVLPISQGLQISGMASFDFFGNSVSSAGDINNDGVDDIIIGAPSASPPGQPGFKSGVAYVIYGQDGGFPSHIDFTVPLPISQGFQIFGGAILDKLGYSVSSAGDVNGDGVDDIIIGAPLADPSGRSSAGAAYVIYGKTGGISADIDLSTPLLLSKGFQITGSAGADNLGTSVSFAGDVNGDGVDDIIIGAPAFNAPSGAHAGAAYVIYGKFGGLTAHLDLSSSLPLSQGFRVLGNGPDASLGQSVGWAGDFNGDNIDDIIIGARGTSPLGRLEAGAVYVIYGKLGGYTSDIDLSTTLSLAQGFQVYGKLANDGLGNAVSSAGDINNDGVDDIIMGAQLATPSGRSSAGIAYIIYGKIGGHTAHIDFANPLSSANGFQILGEAPTAFFGCSVNSAGDVNLDGINDIIVGAYSADPFSRADAGAAFVIYGKTGGYPAGIDLINPLSSAEGFQINGGALSDHLGLSVSSAGDLNNDGLIDIIVGAYNAGPSVLPNTGAAYVLYSQCNLANCAQCTGSKCFLCNQGYNLNSQDYKCYIQPPPSSEIEPSSTDIGESMKSIGTIQNSASDVASLAASTITLIDFINPGGFLFAALAELLQYMKYMSIACPPRLKYLIEENGSDKLFSIEYINSAPPEIEDGIEKYSLADNFSRNKLHSSFLVNFWSFFVNLLIIGTAIVIICLITHCTRNLKNVHPKFLKIKEALKWNYLFGTMIGCYRAVAFFTALEIRSVQFGSTLGILSFLLCLMMNIAIIVLSIKIIRIIKKLVQEKQTSGLETLKKDLREYRILFESLKGDSFVHKGYFLFSCLRLYLFYLILGYLFEYPIFQAILINAQGLAYLSYLLIKRPLKTKLDLVEALILEILLQIVHACVLGLTIIDQTEHIITDAAVFLGDTVIVCNGLLLIVGCIYLLIDALKRAIAIYKYVKASRTKNKKVSPAAKPSAVKPSEVDVEPSIRNSQTDLSIMNDSHRPIIPHHLQNGERSELSRPRYQKTLIDMESKPSSLMQFSKEDSQINTNVESRREIMRQRILSQNSLIMSHKTSSKSIIGDLTMDNNDVSIPNLKKR